MAEKIRLDQIIPAREFASFTLHSGETLRIIDLEGKQMADIIALSKPDKDEKLSCGYSNVLNGT